jgi:hypothetical protein
VPALVLAVVVLAALAVAHTPWVRGVLAGWGIAAPVGSYTEHSFTSPAALTFAPRDGAVPVSFRVHNVEGATRSYEWTATVRPPGGAARPARSGRLTLADGAARTIATTVPVTCTGRRARVDLSIGGPHRTIGFWVDCPGRTS